MRKYLLLLALLATSDAFAWSLDTHVPSKPVCDRIDPAPAKSVAAVHEEVPAPVSGTVATTSATTPATTTATPAKTGGAGFGHAHNTPRWQSFLPGMFK